MLKSHALKAFEIFAESPPIKALKRNPAIKRSGKKIKDFIFPQTPQARYLSWIQRRLEERANVYDIALQPGLLSFVTTVWNTPVEFFEPLAKSLLEQRGGGHFEWVLLDNGTTSAETLRYLETLRNDPRVKLLRVDENQGIIGGMRICLERATGRYIVPIDSDDYLYPDAAQIVTWHLQRHGYPPLVYTDEDKLINGVPSTPFFKPDWDPVLFVNSCYIAHLCAIDRARALELGAYSDTNTNGSHDWDTFVRFTNAGHVPVHVPEITYSWRVHAQSSAGNISSKSYIHTSHRAVLTRWLQARENSGRFQVEQSPLFPSTPDWWIRRLPTEPRRMSMLVFSESAAQAERAIAKLKENLNYPLERFVPISQSAGISNLKGLSADLFEKGSLLALIDARASIERAGWEWEALGLFELFPDTVMVGGRIADLDGTILSAGSILGFGWSGCDSPDRGRSLSDSGYFAYLWKQRSVSAVSSRFAIVDASFFGEFLSETRDSISLDLLGAWLGAYARTKNRRVVYSPFLRATIPAGRASETSRQERARFLERFGANVPDYAVYSRHLGLTPKLAYLPARREDLEAHLKELFPTN